MTIFKALVLSMLPISEVRGGIPYALQTGSSFGNAFILCVLANILIIPLFFIFLDTLHIKFSRVRPYKYFFGKWVNRTRRRIENRIGTAWELPTLFLFVAVPFPLTGAYTGVLAAWLFNINRIKAILTISLGVIAAASIVSLLYFGFFSIF
jgi:uncharacterized membrane protein